VSRLEEGERVEVLDGQGHIGIAEIKTITKKMATLEIIEKRSLPPLPQPEIHFYIGVPKFQTMDLIVQKLVEMGASSITPVLSDRSFIKSKSPQWEEKLERWNKIGLEACKQCGRAWPLKLSPFMTFNEVLEQLKDKPTLFLYEGETSQNIKEALSSFSAPQHLHVLIGAEGGFSPKEVSELHKLEIKSITLGDLVLRVETACITLASVIKYHFNLLQ
jgi:16S rRNA (uracil1498-N3)-methyltransferase